MFHKIKVFIFGKTPYIYTVHTNYIHTLLPAFSSPLRPHALSRPPVLFLFIFAMNNTKPN